MTNQIKLERILNGTCIVLIAITLGFVLVTIGKAYLRSYEAPAYGKAAPRIIEGKYTVIENEAKPVDP